MSDGKQRDLKSEVLVAFHKEASVLAPPNAETRGGPSCPGGVLALAAKQEVKAGLSPSEHTGLCRLMLCQTKSKPELSMGSSSSLAQIFDQRD